MTDHIATVTATVEGEQVENESEVGRRGLASLLGSIFDDDDVSITIHDIHDEEQVEDLKARYEDAWNGRVVEDSEEDEMTTPDVGEAGKCLNTSCEAAADVAVQVNTGQVRHYCGQHRAEADKLGHMVVDEEQAL